MGLPIFRDRKFRPTLVGVLFVGFLYNAWMLFFIPGLYSSTTYLSHPIRLLNAQDRMAQSETNWKRSVQLRHEMATLHPSYPDIPLFGEHPFTIWDFFPATYTCPHDIQRIGRLGDGGKWVCGMSLYEARPAIKLEAEDEAVSTVIYSFGIDKESSFEAEMLRRIPSARIFGYDFSVSDFGPEITEDYRPRSKFGRIKLGPLDYAEEVPPSYSLESLMAQNNHTYIDILKIDIEGAEFGALQAFVNSVKGAGLNNLPISQIIIEIHLIRDAKFTFDRFMTWWEGLEELGMRATWLEVNLLDVTLPAKRRDPRCVEFVLINGKDLRSILRQG